MASSARLVDLCEKVVDCPHSTPVWSDSGPVVLRSHNIRNGRLDLTNPSFTDEAHFADRTRRATPRAGDLVITREAPMGEVAMIPPGVRCCLGQRMVLLRPDPAKVDARYLLYALQSPRLQQEIKVHEGTGSTVSNLRIPMLEDLPIPTLTITDQRRVARILGALDDKIELNRRMSETLEAIARALFKSWFVDFDPVQAKSEGRDPDLPPNVAGLFPDTFVGSEVGEIPDGWDVGSVGTLAHRIVDRIKDARVWQTQPLIDLGRMPQGGIGLMDWGLGGELTTSVTRFQTRDTLFGAIRPYFHKVGIAPIEGVTNTSVFVLRARHETDWPFIAMLCSMDATVDYATRVSQGTKMPVVSWAEFAAYEIPLAPPAIREAFGRLAAPFIDQIIANVHESRVLGAARDLLLPKLMSGEIRVHESARMTEVAVE